MNAKRLCAALAIVGLVLLGGNAFATIGTIEAVPAATLLLPYFEVDLDATTSTNGLNTYFSINNASQAPALAHVVVWSDVTVPVLDFNVYLTGYDVQTFNLHDLFVSGLIPRTANPFNDPGDAISNDGGLTPIPDGMGGFYNPQDLDINSLGNSFDCGAGELPIPQPIPQSFRTLLQNGLTGKAVGTVCFGFNHNDNIARGYITVDNVNICTLDFPGDDGYFDNGEGTASNVNQLWGDFYIIDRPNNFAFGENLVHIEASPTPLSPIGKSFYERYQNFASAADDREALGNVWAARYFQPNDFFTGGTDFIVWREGPNAPYSEFPCANVYPGAPGLDFPLNEQLVVAFDEEENSEPLCGAGGIFPISPADPTVDPGCFPLEAQRVTVGEGDLIPSYPFGWMYLDLDVPDPDQQLGDPNGDQQAWVIVSGNDDGFLTVGYNGIPLNNLTGDPQTDLTANQ